MEKQADDMISVEPSIIPASSSDATEIEEVAETTPTPPVSGTGSENRTAILKMVIFNMMQVLDLFYPKKKKLRRTWKLASFQRLSFTKANIVESLGTDANGPFVDARQMQKRRRTNVLPLSSKDLPNTNTPIQQKALNSKSFLSFAFQSVHDMSPRDYRFILMTCVGLLGYHARNSTTPFDEIHSGKTTNTPQSLISPGKAFFDYSKVIAHMTTFILCYILTCILGWQLRPGAQMILAIVLFTTPLIYFPDQIQQASALEVHVACGTFKLPLIGFTTLAAVGCSFLCGSLVMYVAYRKWKSLRKVNQ